MYGPGSPNNGSFIGYVVGCWLYDRLGLELFGRLFRIALDKIISWVTVGMLIKFGFALADYVMRLFVVLLVLSVLLPTFPARAQNYKLTCPDSYCFNTPDGERRAIKQFSSYYHRNKEIELTENMCKAGNRFGWPECLNENLSSFAAVERLFHQSQTSKDMNTLVRIADCVEYYSYEYRPGEVWTNWIEIEKCIGDRR